MHLVKTYNKVVLFSSWIIILSPSNWTWKDNVARRAQVREKQNNFTNKKPYKLLISPLV